jgi:hypothetical protein
MAYTCVNPVEVYENEDGSVWGYNRNGNIFCSTCGGRLDVPCPRSALEGPFEDENGVFYSCWDCDEPFDERGRGKHERVSCPSCQQ